MSKGNLNMPSTGVDNSRDGVVIVQHVDGIRGGKTLDVTGFALAFIPAGHVIIKSTEGQYKPMPMTGTSYASLPGGHSYVGILAASIPTAHPFASILTHGTVNHKAMVTDISAILAAVKVACPHILFQED